MKKTIIIAGSRSINDYQLVRNSVLDHFKGTMRHVGRIIHGGCPKGVDKLADRFADEMYNVYRIPKRIYYANWDLYGPAAGPIRNSEMVKNGDTLFAFWDGKSKGTADIIHKMQQVRKRVIIINYKSKKRR